MTFEEVREACLEIGKDKFKDIMTDNSLYLVNKKHYDNYTNNIYDIPQDIKNSDALTYTIKNLEEFKAQWKRKSPSDNWQRVSDDEINRMNIFAQSKKRKLKLLELEETDIQELTDEQIAELEALLKELGGENNDNNM